MDGCPGSLNEPITVTPLARINAEKLKTSIASTRPTTEPLRLRLGRYLRDLATPILSTRATGAVTEHRLGAIRTEDSISPR